jgi:hypothetical protein
MIQRIQSIYLLLVAILHIFIVYVPIWVGNTVENLSVKLTGGRIITLKTDGDVEVTLRYLAILATSMVAIFALYTIFQFNKRRRQLFFTRLGLLLSAGTIVLYLMNADVKTEGLKLDPSLGILSLVLALVFWFLAGRGIAKDERKVREADRLR